MDAEVAKPGAERPLHRIRGMQQPVGDVAGTRVGALEAPFEEVDQDAVLVPITNRIEPQNSRLLVCVAIGEADVQPFPLCGFASAHDDIAGGAPVAGRDLFFNAVPHRAKPHEIRVGVENDDPQSRLDKQLLEHGAQRIALPEPDWPQKNVCLPKPPASRRKRTLGSSESEPTSSIARGGRARSSQLTTSAWLAPARPDEWGHVVLEDDAVAQKASTLARSTA